VHKAHSAPATPTMKELTAKALSLAYMGRMPITAAATSMSRMAIHSRPMAPRTRFLASRASTSIARQNRYLLVALSMGMPSTCRLLTDTEPEAVVGEPLDAQEHPVAEELRGQRGHGQVQALDAQAGQAEQDAEERGAQAAQDQRRNQRHAGNAHLKL
jgi:hypothetical protein